LPTKCHARFDLYSVNRCVDDILWQNSAVMFNDISWINKSIAVVQ